jgi:hypothetical protein
VQKWSNGQRSHPNFYFLFFIKNKKLLAIWEVLDTISQIEKIWNFGEWIAKIEILVFELKNAVNFEGKVVNCNFQFFLTLIGLLYILGL